MLQLSFLFMKMTICNILLFSCDLFQYTSLSLNHIKIVEKETAPVSEAMSILVWVRLPLDQNQDSQKVEVFENS